MFEEMKNLLHQKYSVLKNEDVKERLANEVESYQRTIHRKLQIDNPFCENQKQYKQAVEYFQNNKIKILDIKNNLQSFNKLSDISNCKIDNKFWNNEILTLENKLSSRNKRRFKKIDNEMIVLNRLLLKEWDKFLKQEYTKWELSEINKYREKFLEKLTRWLDLLQQLQNAMDDLSLETGLLFDLSKGNISLQDIEELKKWAEYISQNDGVKKLCDMLGKLRTANKSRKQEIIKTHEIIQQPIKDYTSKEEIVGIKIGNELEHVLPQELALLSDEVTSILFDKKFIESELMCFDMQGLRMQNLEVEKEKVIEVSEEDKMGPIIICIDTSGSMSGTPETIAKAVTLYIASRAVKQKRNCYLINFSTSIETLDLSNKMGIKELINFLGRSFHGGTDVAPAINHALKTMQEKNYEKSDLLVISDFVMSFLPNELEENIKNAKKKKNRFYSLAIGNMFLEKRLKDIFDNEWIYNPSSSSISELNSMLEEI